MEFYCADVRKFKLAMGLLVNKTGRPSSLDDFEAGLQLRLIDEEVRETIHKGILKQDVIETIDGLCDTLYVTIGAAQAYGYKLHEWVPKLDDSRNRIHSGSLIFSNPFHYRALLRGALYNIEGAITADEIFAIGPALAGMVSTISVILDAWRIPLRPFWREVQRANMDKLGGSVREDGKRMKPLGWRGPDHAPIVLSVFGSDFVEKWRVK